VKPVWQITKLLVCMLYLKFIFVPQFCT